MHSSIDCGPVYSRASVRTPAQAITTSTSIYILQPTPAHQPVGVNPPPIRPRVAHCIVVVVVVVVVVNIYYRTLKATNAASQLSVCMLRGGGGWSRKCPACSRCRRARVLVCVFLVVLGLALRDTAGFFCTSSLQQHTSTHQDIVIPSALAHRNSGRPVLVGTVTCSVSLACAGTQNSRGAGTCSANSRTLCLAVLQKTHFV